MSLTLVGPEGRDVQAAVTDVGPGDESGRTLVFLHGLAGLNEHWEEVVRRVRDRVRCVMLELPLLDLRGADCSIDGVTELTCRFLEQYLLGGGRDDAAARHAGGGENGPAPRGSPGAVIVGNSFGGHVALRVALERPELVDGLVLAGSSGLIERSMVRDIQLRPTRAWVRRKIAELFYDESVMREADVDRAFAELTDRARARAMVRLSRSARRNHVGDRASAVTAPTLLVWGRQDVVTPPEAAEEFLRLLPDARIVWLDRCGHAPMMERPEEFARAVVEFASDLDRREGRGPGPRSVAVGTPRR
jgi:pimeloyl-ACP methyl ester carboxylesterase